MPSELLAGDVLAGLIHSVSGIEPCAECTDYARQLNALSTCQLMNNIPAIVEHLRQQATERGLPFNQRGATWLVKLAIKLAEQQREPNKFETAILATMRAGTTFFSDR